MIRRRSRPSPRGRIAHAIGIALLLAAAIPTVVLAHPLGNFTINHYAGIRVEPDRVLLDIVIDEAEIPAFQARLGFDTDEDGDIADEERDAGRVTACTDLATQLSLTIDGERSALELVEAGLSFPIGSSGLSTLRLVCGFSAALPTPLDATTPTTIAFADTSDADRLGWREIVVSASGAHVSWLDGGGRETDTSSRLTVYPADRIATPLDDRSVTIAATAGGPTLPAWDIPDAVPVAGTGAGAGAGVGAATPSTTAPTPPAASATPTASAFVAGAPITGVDAGAVPGGSGGELPSIFREANLTPLVLVLSIATAAALGAGHALTPGHGKTLMAAYLVGTRGTPLHALGLGLSVSVSHTVGILVLAAIVVGAADVLPPDLVVRAAPVVAAISILGIGAWMLLGEWRRRRNVAASERAHAAAHAADHDHPHDHDDGHVHGHEDGHVHRHADAGAPGEHRHGGVRHSHLPATGSAITWRSLFVLGLAGGLIPSTSALLILLGSIAAGRAGFGFVLVVAFGVGMAAVMAGIGLAMVLARERVDRLPASGGVSRARELVPLVAAVLVFGFGIYLTAQAIGGAPTL